MDVLNNRLSEHKRQIIFDNVGKLKQKEIAEMIGVTPACVSIIIKQGNLNNECFDIDKEFKKCYGWDR